MTDNQKIGRYEVERRIGRGMQGTVFLARDPVLDRPVAIKLLHGEAPEDVVAEDVVSPLEARISSRLRHPNIVSIFDIGMHNGIPYLVFEYVQGQTLRQMLGSQGALSLEHVCSLAKPILDAVAHAHSLEIVHLDLSPRNVLIDADGRPRIMDFGLSQFAHNIVRDGDVVKGSLLYMAPEHFSSSELGTYTDVFALGAMFYQLVTGVTTVDGDTVKEVVNKIVHGEVDMSLLPEGPYQQHFAEFLRGSQAKDVRMRYANAGAMGEALGEFLAANPLETRGESGSVRSHSTVQFLLRRMQRKEDFPSISRVLVDINRLTNDDGAASADRLANVILRDYGLTNKILKLVNSASFSRGGGEVTSISRAIVVLGFDRVRSTANSLAYFSKLQSAATSTLLKDSMIRSFLSGLLARHLARRARLKDAEEAFICGLFRNLGENLAIYYFPEDYAEVRELVDAQLEDATAASIRVLGVSFAEIGMEVARIWHLPDSIVRSMAPRPSEDDDESLKALRARAGFANDLSALVSLKAIEGQDQAFERLVSRYAEPLSLDADFVHKLFRAGMDKLDQDASILEFDTGRSPFCAAARAWLDRVAPEEADAPEAASG
ncbi:MAG: HDOD domain-containing protein [Gammaproteobacteria bacterium]